MIKYTQELPGDLTGQKTTAIPASQVEAAEWVTPVHLAGSIAQLDVTDAGSIEKLAEAITLLGRMVMPVRDYWVASENSAKTYGTDMHAFMIYNDGAQDVSFSIGGHTMIVKPGESFSEYFLPFRNVSITATTSYRAIVKG